MLAPRCSSGPGGIPILRCANRTSSRSGEGESRVAETCWYGALTILSIGNSDGKYGLWVDKVFQNGSSATSPAYANEVLCAQEGSTLEKARFDCMGLEVWATSG